MTEHILHESPVHYVNSSDAQTLCHRPYKVPGVTWTQRKENTTCRDCFAALTDEGVDPIV